jgi:anthraniloyl-CoA monooxygenase
MAAASAAIERLIVRISIVGGGPAGLYFALLMKKRDPAHTITIVERDGPNDTFGWGIVFSDQTFEYLRDNDAPSYESITAACEKWDNVDIVHRGQKITVRGNRFSGIARLRFLQILQGRCQALGVDLRFHQAVDDLRTLPAADLLVGADGANSLVRRLHRDVLGPSVEFGRNKYIWLGTRRLFHGLTLTFVVHRFGVFTAHSYKFDESTSTFIVECSERTWVTAGLNDMTEADTCGFLEDVFAEALGGEPLLTNNFVRWLSFPLVRNEHWHGDRLVLLGDALHTAHFSIGSGTKLALEDAIALADAFSVEPDSRRALPLFERTRKPRVEQYQAAAHESLRWFEEVSDYVHLDPLQFAVEAMTRSKKIDYEKLRQRDPAFVAAVEAGGRNRGRDDAAG